MTPQAANKLHLLITRPQDKGRELALSLKKLGITSTCQAFFDYKPLATNKQTQDIINLNPKAIVIFVSIAAVNYANNAYPIKHWQAKHFITVGEATKTALQSVLSPSSPANNFHHCPSIHCPTIHNSEGVLTLAVLQQVKHENIIIVRGDGGREHIKNTLEKRQANVTYIESYQKIWRTFNKNIVKKWQAQQINCIVITSNALLESVVHLMKSVDTNTSITTGTDAGIGNYLWIVASKRIADNAKQLGLVNVINANGANDQAIIASLRATINTFQ